MECFCWTPPSFYSSAFITWFFLTRNFSIKWFWIDRLLFTRPKRVREGYCCHWNPVKASAELWWVFACFTGHLPRRLLSIWKQFFFQVSDEIGDFGISELHSPRSVLQSGDVTRANSCFLGPQSMFCSSHSPHQARTSRSSGRLAFGCGFENFGSLCETRNLETQVIQDCSPFGH